MNKSIKAVVTSAGRASYVPLNEPVTIILSKGLPYAIHRLSDGAGTFLFSTNEAKQVEYTLLEEV